MSKLIFTSLLVLLGCAPPKVLPNDFEMSFSASPSQPGAGSGQRISITRGPENNDYFITIVSDKVTRRAVPHSQIQSLYDIIVNDRVFSLKSRYEDMNVLDGATTSVYIKANRKEKKIQLRNTVPSELSRLFDKVNQIVNSVSQE